jgi:hypothetical protein
MITSSTLFAFALMPASSVAELTPLVIAYVGPDQILPFTSFLGAALGVLLLFWNRAVGAARRIWSLLWRK